MPGYHTFSRLGSLTLCTTDCFCFPKYKLIKISISNVSLCVILQEVFKKRKGGIGSVGAMLRTKRKKEGSLGEGEGWIFLLSGCRGGEKKEELWRDFSTSSRWEREREREPEKLKFLLLLLPASVLSPAEVRRSPSHKTELEGGGGGGGGGRGGEKGATKVFSSLSGFRGREGKEEEESQKSCVGPSGGGGLCL